MPHFIFIQKISVLNILNMLYNLPFSLQNAVYFIMLPCLVSVVLTFEIQGVLKFEKIKSVAKRLITRSLVTRGLSKNMTIELQQKRPYY